MYSDLDTTFFAVFPLPHLELQIYYMRYSQAVYSILVQLTKYATNAWAAMMMCVQIYLRYSVCRFFFESHPVYDQSQGSGAVFVLLYR
jgi:hypothetical protein